MFKTKTQVWSKSGHGDAGDPALCVSFSPDGKLVASGGGDTKVRLWKAKTGEQVGASLEAHTAWGPWAGLLARRATARNNWYGFPRFHLGHDRASGTPCAARTSGLCEIS